MVDAGQCVQEGSEGDEGVGADSVPAETLGRKAGAGPTPHTWEGEMMRTSTTGSTMYIMHIMLTILTVVSDDCQVVICNYNKTTDRICLSL